MNKLKERWNVTSNWQLVIIFIVFAITGSTAAYLSKPVTSALGITKENLSLWLYWPFRLLIIFPVYQVMLVIIGAIFGQFAFFWEFEKKMLDKSREIEAKAIRREQEKNELKQKEYQKQIDRIANAGKLSAPVSIEQIEDLELVNTFSNSIEGLNFLKKNTIDVIFLDINMPVLNGWEFLDEYLLIRSMLPKTVVIYMVSSSVDEKDVLKAKNISALSGYLVKPISSQNIMEVILEILN